ncbi:hypothetical protein UlMin_019079 [Ulmus minor]
MKEAAMAASGSHAPGRGGGRSESEKEKTKIRERQRRAITGKIFHGLRKHGGYRLSPRADINEVLRQLAKEAGWIVEPDGNTYRANVGNFCPVCGSPARPSAAPTPTSSIVVGSGGGGECSTTTSPRRLPVGDSTFTAGGGPSPVCISGGNSFSHADIPMALYMYGGFSGGNQQGSTSVVLGGGASPVTSHHHQQFQEARASNQNTPVGSPHRRA